MSLLAPVKGRASGVAPCTEQAPLPEGARYLTDEEVDAYLERGRPKVRSDCRGGPRPCPWVSCRYHLAIVGSNDELGLTRFAGGCPLNLPHTCVLDLSEDGEQTLETISEAIGVSKQRVCQIINNAVPKLASELRKFVRFAPAEPEAGELLTLTTFARRAGVRRQLVAYLVDQGRMPFEADAQGIRHVPWEAGRQALDNYQRERTAARQARGKPKPQKKARPSARTGARLAKLRKRLGLSRRELAELVGRRSTDTVANWERGRTAVPEKVWARLDAFKADQRRVA